MDFLQVVVIVLRDYWYLLFIFVLLVFLKTPLFKGWFGEVIVNLLAWLLLDKNKYHGINNVTLSSEEGTTQIDHIIISVYGVFVVETKNMKGWIFGSADQKTWTQKIYKHTNKFQNPLHQNYKHVNKKKQGQTLTLPLLWKDLFYRQGYISSVFFIAIP